MITLGNFTASDAAELQNIGYRDTSIEELHSMIDTWNTKRYEEKYFEMFAIKHGGVIVGQASLYERSEHIVSSGVEIYPEYQDKGYASLAYQKLLSLAEQKGFSIAVAQVRADNPASIALHKKLGFEAEDYTYINKKGNEVYIFIKALQA